MEFGFGRGYFEPEPPVVVDHGPYTAKRAICDIFVVGALFALLWFVYE